MLHPTDDTTGVDKEITFTPGLAEKGAELAEKIAEEKNEGETTMWEKYQQRRREKQREKRNEKRKAARAKKQGGAASSDDESSDNGAADDSVITLQPDAKEEKARAERKRARAAAKAAQAAHDRAELELVMLDENEDHALALKDNEKDGAQEKKTSKEKRKEFKKKLRESRKTKAKRKQQEKAEAEAEASKLIAGADDRFAEIFTSSEFAPDPTNPEYVPDERYKFVFYCLYRLLFSFVVGVVTCNPHLSFAIIFHSFTRTTHMFFYFILFLNMITIFANDFPLFPFTTFIIFVKQ